MDDGKNSKKLKNIAAFSFVPGNLTKESIIL